MCVLSQEVADPASVSSWPWIDALLDQGEKFFEQTGKPLYSSHMLDLSEEELKESTWSKLPLALSHSEPLDKASATRESR